MCDALTFFKGKISSSDYANRYGVSTKTAKRDLSDMSDKNGSVPKEKYRAIMMFGVVEHQLQFLVLCE